MKIRLREHAKFQADKMAKIALAATPRVQLDLYCVEPGQAQKVHSHDDAGQDLLRAGGRADASASAATRSRWRPARPSWRRRALAHGVVNDSGPPGCWCSCVVSPPPPHA